MEQKFRNTIKCKLYTKTPLSLELEIKTNKNINKCKLLQFYVIVIVNREMACINIKFVVIF